MPNYLDAAAIQDHHPLDWRAKVTYPNDHLDYPTIERVGNVLLGENPQTDWQLPYLTADEEYPGAVLVVQVKLTEDDATVRVQRIYETLPGLPVAVGIREKKYDTFEITYRQRVAAAIQGADSPVTLSDNEEGTSAVVATRTWTVEADATGAALATSCIVTTSRIDEEMGGVTVYTDTFKAPIDYVLPKIMTAGNLAEYVSWKQPASGNLGYSSTEYSPVHWPIDAQKIDIEDSPDSVIIKVDHCRVPHADFIDEEAGYRWPAIFEVNPTFIRDSSYIGTPPPWPIGADQPNGYTLIAHRQAVSPQRRYITWHVGKATGLPPAFRVVSPGVASNIFRGFIVEDTIHGPIIAQETLSNGSGGTNTVLIENIPASTPRDYNAYDLYVIRSSQRRVRGELHRAEVVIASERTPLDAFPNPVTDGFYDAMTSFQISPHALISGLPGNRKVYLRSSGASVSATIYGISVANPHTGYSETVAVTSSAVASAVPLSLLYEVLLAAPLATDTVSVYAAVNPDYASLQFTALPAAGDTLIIGLAGSERTYTFVSALTGTANEILIASTYLVMGQWVANTITALGYESGSEYSVGTAAHADIAAARDRSTGAIVEFTRLDPITNSTSPGSDYTFTINLAGGGGASWATITPWASGGVSTPLATIAPGALYAFRLATKLVNPSLLDNTAANDVNAVDNLPGAPVLYTDWIKLPDGVDVTLRYNAIGARPLRVSYQLSADGITPAATSLDPPDDVRTLDVTHGSATATVTDSEFIATALTGQSVFIGDDPAENVVLSVSGDPPTTPETFTLLNPYLGTTNTAATLKRINLGAETVVPSALLAQLRNVDIGTHADYIRLKFIQKPPYTARAVAACLVWRVYPDA